MLFVDCPPSPGSMRSSPGERRRVTRCRSANIPSAVNTYAYRTGPVSPGSSISPVPQHEGSTMKATLKQDLPVAHIRRYLEPGPIVLVSSAWKGKTNIMTLGWHTVLDFEPSRIGCHIWDENH